MVSALLRNTDIAPSTTQNPCSTGNTCVTATASANPSPVRRLLRSTTARVAEESLGDCGDGDRFGHHPVRCAGLGQPAAEHPGPDRPGVRGRGVADDAAGHRDGGRDGAAVQQRATHLDRGRIVGLTRASARCRHGSVPCAVDRCSASASRRSSLRAAARGRAAQPEHRRGVPQHPHRGFLHRPEQPAGVLGDLIGQPAKVVDHPDQRAAARGQRDGPDSRRRGSFVEGVHRLGDITCRCGALEPIRQPVAHPGRVPAQVVVMARREQEHRRGHAERQRDHPAEQPLRQWADGRAGRKHEHQQGGALACGDDLAEHPGEGHRHPEHEHHRDAQPWVWCDHRAQRDEDRAVEAEAAVRQRTGGPVAGKVDHDQQRHRPEDREQRCLRATADGEADRRGRSAA